MFSYGANGSPTITLTKTLFAAAATTSTKSSTTSSSSATQGTVASPQLPSASPRVGVVADGNGIDGNSTVTSTRVSTIFNTITVTSTSMASTSSSSSSSSQTSADSVTESTSSTEPSPATATATGTFSPAESNSAHTSKVAGSVIGSFAAFGMIGFLLWYFCMKKNGKEKLKVKMSLRRRESSSPKTPQLEEQNIEETRAMMLQRQAELNKSKEDVVSAFLATSTDRSKPMSPRFVGPESPRRVPVGRPSMIGVATTSTTPPNTPPLPRTNSQRSKMNPRTESASMGHPGSHPTSLMPGVFVPRSLNSSPSPSTPLKSVRQPAPIVTAYALTSYGKSPLSPKGVFNAIGNTTNRAWKRASQALSPSAYQRLPERSHSVFQSPKRRDSEKPRIESLEIGAQTDTGNKSGWI